MITVQIQVCTYLSKLQLCEICSSWKVLIPQYYLEYLALFPILWNEAFFCYSFEHEPCLLCCCDCKPSLLFFCAKLFILKWCRNGVDSSVPQSLLKHHFSCELQYNYYSIETFIILFIFQIIISVTSATINLLNINLRC